MDNDVSTVSGQNKPFTLAIVSPKYSNLVLAIMELAFAIWYNIDMFVHSSLTVTKVQVFLYSARVGSLQYIAECPLILPFAGIYVEIWLPEETHYYSGFGRSLYQYGSLYLPSIRGHWYHGTSGG
ncbi:hypothetical protein J3R83DRAFT_7887 [Lanmaoa asiatica]|nr:hypothetical protein J3R83DRAFT_7887 [Lanmaoa asiatica]